MIEPIIKQLEPIVADELRTANLANPPFHSRHEGMAVIDEEVWEVGNDFENMKECMENFRRQVFRDHVTTAFTSVVNIRANAIRMAAEAVQVAAMCNKYMERYGSDDTVMIRINGGIE